MKMMMKYGYGWIYIDIDEVKPKPALEKYKLLCIKGKNEENSNLRREANYLINLKNQNING